MLSGRGSGRKLPRETASREGGIVPITADAASCEAMHWLEASLTKRIVVTGATGLLGSHIVEQLIGRGEQVRALVRAGSDTARLRRLGVELVEGDLQQPASLPRAVADADVVYHCAARVGDWGPWRAYKANIVAATQHVLDACRTVG